MLTNYSKNSIPLNFQTLKIVSLRFFFSRLMYIPLRIVLRMKNKRVKTRKKIIFCRIQVTTCFVIMAMPTTSSDVSRGVKNRPIVLRVFFFFWAITSRMSCKNHQYIHTMAIQFRYYSGRFCSIQYNHERSTFYSYPEPIFNFIPDLLQL